MTPTDGRSGAGVLRYGQNDADSPISWLRSGPTRMASIDVGRRSGRRAVDRDLPLVPFIDFLLCIVAFLLVTAVWSRMSRLEADALAPGNPAEPSRETPARVLHVEWNGEQRFQLVWRQGSTVVATESIDVPPVVVRGGVRYAALAEAVARSWHANGVHRGATDRERDRAVVHASNQAPFERLAAVMDAVAATRREVPGARGDIPAFHVALATD
jgi:biopolymer transport protein ExbD